MLLSMLLRPWGFVPTQPFMAAMLGLPFSTRGASLVVAMTFLEIMMIVVVVINNRRQAPSLRRRDPCFRAADLVALASH